MQIQSICENLGKSGCLCFCDAFLAGVDPIRVVEKYNELLDARVIKPDGYILSHEGFLKILTDKDYKYVRLSKQPKSGLYIANYTYKQWNHFVVCEKAQVVFNSLDYSNCVAKGTPGDFRVLYYTNY